MGRATFALVLCALVFGAGCATTRGAAKKKEVDPIDRVLAAAARLVGENSVTVRGESFRADCSGFVCAAYSAINLDLIDSSVRGSSGTELLYRTFLAKGLVQGGLGLRPGDLLFFHNTWDRNHNGLRDDRFTHVALVEEVGSDGRAVFLHFASGRVKRGSINLRHPGVSHDPDSGAEWNSHLRRKGGKTLTGQLFFRSARPL
jgi:cell wall-associated NlpC family hydrolase